MVNETSQIPLRVAYYLRVSTEDQVKKYGTDAQKATLDKLVSLRSETMVMAGEQYIYSDDGISGTTDIYERPAFAKMIEDIENSPADQKPFDIVAIYKIDRLARRLRILLEIIDFFNKHNIQFVSATESIDTSTHYGRAMLGIIGAIAELEIEVIKERTQAGREQAIQKGKYMGSGLPYGYKKDDNKMPIEFELESKIIKQIFHSFVNLKNTPQMIASELTNQEIITPSVSAIYNGKRKGEVKKTNSIHFWRANTIRDILSNEIYIGNFFYNKNKNGKTLPKSEWKLSKYEFPRIIDNVTFYKTQKLLKESRFFLQNIPKHIHLYLLRGLIKCDNCKNLSNDQMIRWNGEPKKIRLGSTTYFYKCGRKNQTKFSSTCNTIPLPADEIEDYVVNYVKKLLNNPMAVYEYQSKLKSTKAALKDIKEKSNRIAKLLLRLPERKKRVMEMFENSYIKTSKELGNKIKEIETSEKNLKKQFEELGTKQNSLIINQGYINSIELFSKKYRAVLEDIYKNRQEVYDIIHNLIEEIVIYSRPTTDKDVIAGRPKENQLIPYRLHIKLRLPKDILQNMYSPSEKYIDNVNHEVDFGVENAKL